MNPATTMMFDALKVLTTCEKTRKLLSEQDPQALRQADRAVEAYKVEVETEVAMGERGRQALLELCPIGCDHRGVGCSLSCYDEEEHDIFNDEGVKVGVAIEGDYIPDDEEEHNDD